MAGRAVLTVVVVRDPALRRALGLRLADSDIHVITETGANHRRPIRRPTILLASESAVAGELGERIAREWADDRWRRVEVLTLDAPVDAGDADWQLFGSASDKLESLFADWTAIEDVPDKSGDALVIGTA